MEYWAGHYGTRFRQERVSLVTEDRLRNWIKTIPVRHTTLRHHYTTFFNKGEGSKFYYFGE